MLEKLQQIDFWVVWIPPLFLNSLFLILICCSLKNEGWFCSPGRLNLNLWRYPLVHQPHSIWSVVHVVFARPAGLLHLRHMKLTSLSPPRAVWSCDTLWCTPVPPKFMKAISREVDAVIRKKKLGLNIPSSAAIRSQPISFSFFFYSPHNKSSSVKIRVSPVQGWIDLLEGSWLTEGTAGMRKKTQKTNTRAAPSLTHLKGEVKINRFLTKAYTLYVGR